MMLMTRPINVSAFGEMRVSARPFTIFWSSQPLPLPNALVQVKKNLPFRVMARFYRFLDNTSPTCPEACPLNLFGYVVDGEQLEDLELAFAVRSDDRSSIANLFTQERTANR